MRGVSAVMFLARYARCGQIKLSRMKNALTFENLRMIKSWMKESWYLQKNRRRFETQHTFLRAVFYLLHLNSRLTRPRGPLQTQLHTHLELAITKGNSHTRQYSCSEKTLPRIVPTYDASSCSFCSWKLQLQEKLIEYGTAVRLWTRSVSW